MKAVEADTSSSHATTSGRVRESSDAFVLEYYLMKVCQAVFSPIGGAAAQPCKISAPRTALNANFLNDGMGIILHFFKVVFC